MRRLVIMLQINRLGGLQSDLPDASTNQWSSG